MDREQLRAPSTLAAIELDRIQAEHINTETDRALGETGAGVENEVLGPFLGNALRVGGVDEIAVDEEIPDVQIHFGIVDESGCLGGEWGNDTGSNSGGKRGNCMTIEGHSGVPFYSY
jgi:hypothetical protein